MDRGVTPARWRPRGPTGWSLRSSKECLADAGLLPYPGSALQRICAATAELCAFLDIRAVGSERFGCSPSSLAWRMDKQGHPHPDSGSSEQEPMSSAPPSDDEFPIQDDETGLPARHSCLNP